MEAEALIILQVVCAAVAVAHTQDHDKRRRHAVESQASGSIAVELTMTGWEEFELAEWRGEEMDATVVIGCE